MSGLTWGRARGQRGEVAAEEGGVIVPSWSSLARGPAPCSQQCRIIGGNGTGRRGCAEHEAEASAATETLVRAEERGWEGSQGLIEPTGG